MPKLAKFVLPQVSLRNINENRSPDPPKHPPRKKKPAAPLEVPAVVRTEPTRRPRSSREPAIETEDSPRKSAIVTIRKHGSDRVPDMTPEEHQRRGDAAEAIFREIQRRIAATKRP
jgi:hypothetical protein